MLKQGSNLKLYLSRTRTKTKPHVPQKWKWGFTYVLCGAFVSHASSISEGLRAKKLKTMVLKGAEKVKEFKGIMEYWKNGMVEGWAKKDAGS